MPFWYSADLQYNIIKKDRFAYKCRIGGSCHRREKAATLGYSIQIAERFDDTKSAAIIDTTMEFQSNESNSWFNELFIWNRGISGVENYIQYLNFDGSKIKDLSLHSGSYDSPRSGKLYSRQCDDLQYPGLVVRIQLEL